MKSFFVFCVVVVVAIAGGCVSSAPTTVEKQGGEYEVIVNSLVLNNHIKFIERSTRRVNGLLEAQVRMQNIKSKDVDLEYRYIWLDKDGIRIDTTLSTWKQLSLQAKEITFMKGIAPTPKATDFLMAVHFAHHVTH